MQPILAWENSQYFVTPLLVSPLNEVWGPNAKIPYLDLGIASDRMKQIKYYFQPLSSTYSQI